jgi:L-fuculose-phosphate aldolase
MTTVPDARHAVVELCLALSRRGYLAGTGGNIALRIDERHFAVTPSATDYLAMTAADVCVLRLADLACVEGERTPSVESGLHARVLRARPDVQCSIHTHQPVASACALLGRPLAVDDETLRRTLGPRVPIVGYAPSGTGWLSAKLGRALRPELNAYLMLNHGVLCCGPSTEAAVQAVEALEALARQQLLALMSGHAHRAPALKAALARVAETLAAPATNP